MTIEFIVDKYNMTIACLNDAGETFAHEFRENTGEFAVTGRFPTVRKALDAILEKHGFSASAIEWVALESASRFGRKVTYYANFADHGIAGTSNVNVRANVLKAVLSMPDAADAADLNGKAE